MKRVFLVLLAATVLLCACGAREAFAWDDVEMSGVLPRTKSTRGKFWQNDESNLVLEVEGVSQNDYGDYLSSCKEQGFTVEGETSGSSYEAYNREGYKLRLSYWESKKRLSIYLDAPMEMGTLQWPKSDIAALLPVPQSTVGKTRREGEDGFAVYVGDTSQEEFRAYADACAERGFTAGYQRGDDYYYADNAEGFHLDLRYEGNRVMLLEIDAPEQGSVQNDVSIFEQETPGELEEPEATEVPEEPQPTEAATPEPTPELTPEPEQPRLVNGMRPEFKEARDSYEAFFDDYCDFMKKLDRADSVSAEMLTEYLEYLDNYTDAMEKLEAWDSGDMNDAEWSYYLKVMTRINEKLMSVAD